MAEKRKIRYDAKASEFNPHAAKTKIAKERLSTKKLRFLERVDKTARAELLTSEKAGYFLIIY